MKRICPLLDVVTFAAEKRQTIRLVVYHQAGSNLVEDNCGQADEHEIFSGKMPFRIPQNEIGQLTDYLRELAGVVDTMWLGSYTEARVSLDRLRPAVSSGFVIHDQVLEVFAQIEQSIQAKVRERTRHFTYVPFAEVMTIDRNFLLVDGCLTFRDEDHLSRCRQLLVGKPLARFLGSIFAAVMRARSG